MTKDELKKFQQKIIIAKCKEAGYGWAKYAESVEKQGFYIRKARLNFTFNVQ